MNTQSHSLTRHVDGILVLGTDARCGKTTVMAGLAAAIGSAGFRVQALKPLEYATELSIGRGNDQAFLNKVTQQFIQAETLYSSSPWEVSMPLWIRILEQCKTLQYPCLLESPGQVATPWQIMEDTVSDGLDVAKQLGLSTLLVARDDETFLEKARAAITFIQSRQINLLGFIRAQTAPPARQEIGFPQEALLMSKEYAVPFLGDLPYSPSISVPGLQQGNLIRLIEENIDLLPLQMGIGLKL